MPTIEQLSKLFVALAHKDLDAAERQARVIAAAEDQKGHTTAAQILKGALAANGVQGIAGQETKTGATTVLAGALSRRTSAVLLNDVVLRAATRSALDDLVREFKGQSELKARGIRRRSKLIFHGPPGCGKTLTAQALANAMQLPLYVVRFDAVVGSYLGQTAAHLRQLFQFAESTRSVLLFDEIDALGKRRGSPSDVGELDRIVIALMQELELSEIPGFVIATSNLPGSLDDALWRRFDLSVKFAAPTKGEVTRFARAKAKAFSIPATKVLLAKVNQLRSYADVEVAVEGAARRAALRDI